MENNWKKFSLGKVKIDWYSDVERIISEQQAMQVLFELLPLNSIPKVVHVDLDNYIYIMTCAPDSIKNLEKYFTRGEDGEARSI